MRDALARAQRFRSRAQQFQRLADTCGSPEFARHYYLILKHFLALAHLEEDQVTAPSKERRHPHLRPISRAGNEAGAVIFDGPGRWEAAGCRLCDMPINRQRMR